MIYDPGDRLTATLADNTAETTTAYDGANRAILVTDPLGNTMSYAYDGNGNTIQTLSAETYVYDEEEDTTVETFTSVAFYDCLNRTVATATQGADGNFAPVLALASNYSAGSTGGPATMFSLMGYDSRGNATLTVDPNGNSVIFEFDGASRRIETDQLQRLNGQGSNTPVGNQSFLSAGRGLVRTQMVFDGNSRLATLIDDRGNETGYTYDLLDRQVTMTFQDGSIRTSAYDLAGDVTTYTDENGSIFTSSFDPLGRRYSVTITAGIGIGGTTGQGFEYDGLSRMTQSQDIISSGTTATNNFVYDSMGRLLEEQAILSDLATPSRYTTHSQFFSYVVQQLTYPNTSRQTSNTYDLMYRRTDVAESAGGAGSDIADWTFIGPTRVVEMTLGNGLICTQLNNARQNSAVQSAEPNPAWGDVTTDRLGYDGSGRMITKRYLAGGINSDSLYYNNSSALVGFTTCYDLAGNKAYERHLHVEERSHLYLPVPYIGFAAVSSTTPVPAGYDSLNRLQQYQRGNLTTTGGIAGAGGGSILGAIALPATHAMQIYNLDGLGNWITTTYTEYGMPFYDPVTQVRRHNSVNELTYVTTQGGTGTPPPPFAITYDHGNNAASSDPLMQQRGNGNIANDGTLIYAYDALNRLIQVNGAGSGTPLWAKYTYDALGRRIRKAVSNGGLPGTLPNGTTDYLYDGQQIIEDRSVAYSGTTGTECIVAQYVWGMYIDELIQMKTYVTLGAQLLGAGNYYLLSDLLYRSVALTNNTGAIVEAYDTDAYGNTLMFSAPGAGSNWFGDDAVVSTYPVCTTVFTGRQYDPETLLYNYRARYYNPPLGRFISRDPAINLIGFRDYYAYCGGQPLTATDSSGLAAQPCTGAREIEYREMYINAMHTHYSGEPNPFEFMSLDQVIWLSERAFSEECDNDNPNPAPDAPPVQSGWEALNYDFWHMFGLADATCQDQATTKYLKCLNACIVKNDPLNLVAQGAITVLGTPIPKVLVRLFGGRTTVFGGNASRLTTPASIASNALGLPAQNALRTTGEISFWTWIVYEDIMATVETYCATTCANNPSSYS